MTCQGCTSCSICGHNDGKVLKRNFVRFDAHQRGVIFPCAQLFGILGITKKIIHQGFQIHQCFEDHNTKVNTIGYSSIETNISCALGEDKCKVNSVLTLTK